MTRTKTLTTQYRLKKDAPEDWMQLKRGNAFMHAATHGDAKINRQFLREDGEGQGVRKRAQ
jgi:hypothetical protein